MFFQNYTFECTTRINTRTNPVQHFYKLLLWLSKSDLHNFVDDNTIAVTCKNLNDLLRTLEKESESPVDWFRRNNMIANPDKFQVIIMNKRRENQITHKLKIYNNEINTTKYVKLLGMKIDNQLSFNQQI